MAINRVTNENIMFTKYPSWLFLQMLALEDGEMYQIELPITQLRGIYINSVVHNKQSKGNTAACY